MRCLFALAADPRGQWNRHRDIYRHDFEVHLWQQKLGLFHEQTQGIRQMFLWDSWRRAWYWRMSDNPTSILARAPELGMEVVASETDEVSLGLFKFVNELFVALGLVDGCKRFGSG